MKTRLAILLPIIAVCSGCCASRLLQQPVPASSTVGAQDGRTERISKVVQETMRKKNVPGISVAVIDHGQLVWAQGFGWRDVQKRLPVDTDTQFQAGSISKPVSALGVLRLSGAGKVELDRDVNSYLKGWHLDYRCTNVPVTLRQLLCHRAGMEPHGFQGFREARAPPSLMEVLTRPYFLNGPVKVKYPPGSRYKYSGGGYCVAQKVVEDVTAEPFEVAMTQLLLEPLQMSRSDFRQPPSDTTNTARGYGGARSLIFPGRWRLFPQMAAAGLWSTPQDLARLMIAMQMAKAGDERGPISPAIAEMALKPQFDEWQGIGFRLDGEGRTRGFYHYGKTVGYFASFGAGVSNGRGWVIMANAEKKCFAPIVKSIGREFGWTTTPNTTDAPNPAIALPFHGGHH